MKVQLIYAAASKYPRSSDLSGWCPPLGLLSIATELHRKTNTHVEIYDSQIQSKEWISQRLDGDIVGIGCGVLSYEDALDFARRAKNKGSKIVLGGAYVSSISKIIIKNQGNLIDNVVVGHGTPTLEKLILGENISRVEKNPIDLSRQPIPDRSLLPKEEYFKAYNQKFPHSPFKFPTNMVPQIGCMYKSKGGGCIFCSGQGLLTSKKPEQFWEELEKLKRQGYDHVSIQGEEFLGDRSWFNEIYKRRPKKNLPLDIITRASAINEKTIKMLNKMNTHQIFMGVESGSQRLLDSSLKGIRKEQVENALKLMKDYSIRAKIPFVLGLPGETQETLDETKRFAKHLTEIGDIRMIGVNILTPIPGSPAYEMFTEKFPQYKNMDIFPIEESRKLWVNEFCNINYSELEKAIEEIGSLAKFNWSFAR